MKLKIIKIVVLLFISITITSQVFKPVNLSEIKSTGWIQSQIARDWNSGVSSVMYNNAFFPTTLGVVKTGGNITAKFKDANNRWVYTWDYSEMEGNLADAAVRAAFLTNNSLLKTRFKYIMDFMVDSIAGTLWADTLAYSVFSGGELFNQTCMERAMLAYYEYSGDIKYLNAVKKIVDKSIIHFGGWIDKGDTYFGRSFNGKGYLYHSLVYSDILEYLYRKTSDRKYVDFGFKYYNDFTKQVTLAGDAGNADITLTTLADASKKFLGHGPHTAEQIRMPLWLSIFAKDSSVAIQNQYKNAIANIPVKLNQSLSPSKGLVTDPAKWESINGKFSSGNLKYEYCSITETMNSLNSMVQKFGKAEYANDAEILFFNAAQGARLPDGKGNTYLVSDNTSKALLADNFRYQYAALHSIRCCNLNAERIAPYYVANMWMKSEDDKKLVAMLHGPSEVETTLNGVKVLVDVNTNYPFEDTLRYTISPTSAVDFTLVLRNPLWSEKTKILVDGATINLIDGYYHIQKNWTLGEKITVVFDPKIELKQLNTADSKDFFIQRGALVYAYPYDNVKTGVAPRPAFSAFSNWDIQIPSILTSDFSGMNIYIDAKAHFVRDSSYIRFKSSAPFFPDFPYDFPQGKITARFAMNGNMIERDLVPMGCVQTRRTTFTATSVLNAVTPSTIELLGVRSVTPATSYQFTALVKDQNGNLILNPSLNWSVTQGSISQQGLFVSSTVENTAIVSIKCGSISSNFSIIVRSKTAIKQILDNTKGIFPTCTKSDIFIPENTPSVSIFSLDGRLVFYTIHPSSKINISGLKPGVYLLKTNTTTVRIIKL